MIKTFKCNNSGLQPLSLVSVISEDKYVTKYMLGNNFGVLIDTDEKNKYAWVGIFGYGQVKVNKDVIVGDVLAYFRNENTERKLIICEDGKAGYIVRCYIDSKIIEQHEDDVLIGQMISETKYQMLKNNKDFEFCLLDGRCLWINEYPELYSLIEYMYNINDEPKYTFRVPNYMNTHCFKNWSDIDHKWIRIK